MISLHQAQESSTRCRHIEKQKSASQSSRMTPAHWCSQIQPIRFGAKTSTVTSNVSICMKYFPPAIIHLRGEQETSFGGESQRTKLMKDYVKDLYKRLSENIGETPELFHYDYFKLEGGELYYIGSRKPLTTEGKLKSVGMIADILGKNRLRRLGFNIPVGRLTARQAVMLNKAAEELPSESDITKVDDIRTPRNCR